MSLEVGRTFWVLVPVDGDSNLHIFTDRGSAISTLKDIGGPDTHEVMKLTCESAEKWEIGQLSWKEIAMELMK